MENVAEVMVSGEKNPILGNIVCAKVRLRRPEDPKDYSRQLRLFCRGRLQSYQVPVRIDVVENTLHGERFKKMRRTEPMGG
jgi:acyl-coenzyme A synthetase/AMP-(fatty) acid ligase